MPRICYQPRKFSPERLDIIQQVNRIVADYKAQGYSLTLRQVYYQFVSRDAFPESWKDPKTGSTNNERSYKNLASIVSDARLAGLVDWNAIEDRTREMDGNHHFMDPGSAIQGLATWYRIDTWEEQPYAPEVWVEKDALEGVVGKICRELDIPFFSCRGYTSQTAMWNNGQRLREFALQGRTPYVLHSGTTIPAEST